MIGALADSLRREGLRPAAKRALTRARGWMDVPWLRFSHLLPGPPNDLEVRILALRRSGHHAILNWITRQWPGRHCILNNCEPGQNPLLHARRRSPRVHSFLGDHERLLWKREAEGRFSRKGMLVYNYEDRPIPAVLEGMSPDTRRRWVGASRRQVDVLILRDPYNLLASKLRWAYGTRHRPSPEEFPALVELWKDYAREFLRETQLLEEPVCVSYNRWFTDRGYRKTLCPRLGIPFTDEGLERVARWGPLHWGDSFDGLRYDGRAQAMPVLERWKAYVDDPCYRALVQDPELAELSDRIFGRLPGIETVVAP